MDRIYDERNYKKKKIKNRKATISTKVFFSILIRKFRLYRCWIFMSSSVCVYVCLCVCVCKCVSVIYYVVVFFSMLQYIHKDLDIYLNKC